MNTGQRSKANHPCPVCGGHDSQPHGVGSRCYGFLSDDGLYAHCTRENYAGKLVLKPKSDTYAHSLRKLCLCGEEHGSVVDAAPHKTLGGQSIDTYHDPKLGKPTRLWPYRYANGTLACYVARWDLPVGGKEIRPLVLENGMWKQGGISQPLPLYNLPALVEGLDAPVLVVEGEKTSDAAGEIFPSHVSTTSMYGAKSPHQSDWTPLKGRKVVIWPDNDSDGQGYASKVGSLALKAGASGVRIVQLPEELPVKWDLADPVPEWVDLEKLLALARIHRGRVSGQCPEAAKGRSSESGIMVLKQKTSPRKGAPNRCYHAITLTASKSPSMITAWWPMPACSSQPPWPCTSVFPNWYSSAWTWVMRRAGPTPATR